MHLLRGFTAKVNVFSSLSIVHNTKHKYMFHENFINAIIHDHTRISFHIYFKLNLRFFKFVLY